MRLSRSAALLAVLALLPLQGAARAGEVDLEYRVKAAYVSKFLLFVEWVEPEGVSGVITVGVAGDPEVQRAMLDLEGLEVGSARVAVRAVETPEDLAGCQVLFVGASREPSPLLAGARGQPLLTVGERPGFANRGGIINFFIAENTVRFEINVDAAQRAGLKISSRLLRLARVLREDGS